MPEELVMEHVEISPEAIQVSPYLVLPASTEHKLHQCFDVQSEYVNETDFAEVAIDDAVKFYLKQLARGVLNEWEREIQRVQKRRQEFDRKDAIAFLRKTKSGQSLEERAILADGIISEYKG
jgi:hypothetical protein